MQRVLMSGNEAIAEGALRAGCRFYAGYPITPQNELIGYMATHMPRAGGVFIQAESELAAINMVFGAAAAGARAMTSSSSPGISLKQEGISYLAGAQLPAVIVNVMRGGPGLGNIAPAQSDYFQATRGGGHGDYHCIVLAPSTVQESLELMNTAFILGERYRNPVMILSDGMLGQMMEPVELSDNKEKKTENRQLKTKKWVLTGCQGRKPNVVRSFRLAEGELEKLNRVLQKKYARIEANQQRWEELYVNGARIIMVAYGSMARIAKEAMRQLRQEGIKVGLIRPITLWPFPRNVFTRITQRVKSKTFLVAEMSYGQMVEDVRLCAGAQARVEFLGRGGGGIISEEAIVHTVRRLTGR